MSRGVYTPEKRVEFVKGWLTGGTDPGDGSVECGSGTDYPMLVTRDQLAEIMYRVRLAWFTSGTFYYTDDAGGGATGDLAHYAPTGDPPVSQLFEYAHYDILAYKKHLGYCTIDESSPITLAHHDALFGVEYSSFDQIYYKTTYARDIAESEFGMWIFPTASDPHPKINRPEEFRNGMTCYVGHTNEGNDLTAGPLPSFPTWLPYSTHEDAITFSNATLNLDVTFSGMVAYTGSRPFDPTARLFVGVKFTAFGLGDTLGNIFEVLNTKQLADAADTGLKFSLKLSGGAEVHCPLYSYMSGSSGTSGMGGTNFVCEAKEWWPYAKGNPAAPVWDSATGLKL